MISGLVRADVEIEFEISGSECLTLSRLGEVEGGFRDGGHSLRRI
jgi:hypothetical protein